MSYKINDKCVGCSVCKSRCPVDAICGELEKVHTINLKRCVECGVCANFCNMGAITTKDGQVVSMKYESQIKKPKINAQICSGCSICVDICSAGCLEISLPKQRDDISLYACNTNPQNCVGCELCSFMCPLDAIEMEVPLNEFTPIQGN